MIQIFVNYIRSCFCRHKWELILEKRDLWGKLAKVYRCTKCGYSRTYEI